MVHHCPRCELRFRSEAELTEHLDVDHHAPHQAWERYRYPKGPRQAPLYPEDVERDPDTAARYLVVGNQTLNSPELIDHITGRAAARLCSFTVVVPATSTADYPQGALTFSRPVTGAGERHEGGDAGAAQARWRLRQSIDTLRAAGVEVDGAIGSPDPFTAVQQIARRESFDAVILSVLPPGLSRWLSMDLPQRIERQLHLPVTTVVASDHPGPQSQG